MKASRVRKFNEGKSTRGGPLSRSRAGYERLKAKEAADEQIAEIQKKRLDRLKEAAVYRYNKGIKDYGEEAIYDPPGSSGYKVRKFLRQNVRDPLENVLMSIYGGSRITPEGVEGPDAAELRARRERLGYRKGGSVKLSASRRADGIAKKGKTRGTYK